MAKDTLGESRVGAPPYKEILWWNENVKISTKIKKDLRYIWNAMMGYAFERCKLAKEAKKGFWDVSWSLQRSVWEVKHPIDGKIYTKLIK